MSYKLEFYKVFPYLIDYNANLPSNVGGRAKYGLIKIKDKYKDDTGIKQHEIKHVLQWYMLFGLLSCISLIMYFLNMNLNYIEYITLFGIILGFSAHRVLYTYVSKYRLYTEVQAYRKQLEHTDKAGAVDWYATFISKNYKLDISISEAKHLLTK